MLQIQRLRELRKRQGLIQQDMANLLRISRTAYVKYEKGQAQPPNDSLLVIADFFRVSTDYLLGNTDDPTISGAKKEAPTEITAEALMRIAEERAGRPLTQEELIILRARVADLKATIDQITENKN